MSYEQIPGWMKFQQTYIEAVKRAPATGARFLEIGTAFGRSAAFMGELIAESGKAIDFAVCDPWLYSPKWGGGYHELVEAFGSPRAAFDACMRMHAWPTFKAKWFDVFQMTSATLADALQHSEPDGMAMFDFVFIDGDHSYEAVTTDIARWLPHMKPGGIIAGDDYSEDEYPGVVQAVNEAFGSDFEQRRREDWRHWVYYVPGRYQGTELRPAAQVRFE